MTKRCITDLPGAADMVRFRGDWGQRFIVTVDTEEEFDWTRPIGRAEYGLDHVRRIADFQQFCEGHGVVPLYLVDYPIATSEAAAEVLRQPLAEGRAEVGVQLHPWVNPPFDEEICEFNSFSGNLPAGLERDKFHRLYEAIQKNFGKAPLSYRAGRYGVGPNTTAILCEHGIAVDTSARARFDYSSTGGPNFRDLPVTPWWVDREQGLMEMPLTTVYWGLLRKLGPFLYPRMWRIPRLRGLLAHIGLLERIPLTPEGVNQTEVTHAINLAVDDGLPVLVFSFHSPSLAPGHTPYVRSDADLDAFYDWWRSVFATLKARGVQPTSLTGVMEGIDLA